MSRLTAAQIVSLGEYLEPDFEASSLTNAQLLGVFGYHNIPYPSQFTKAKLVQLFNDEIKVNAKKLKKERIKRENSQASDDGIKDGLTGKLLSEPKTTARRTSRRLSRAPPEEQPTEPEPAAKPKRRRSSAEPTLGGPSRRKSTKPAEPVVVEESEPEEEEIVMPRKVGRSKKTTTAAGAQARRVSQAFPEDSGWEDNNIFQSGAESSSPARPSPVKPRARRLSNRALKARQSMSAPPQMSSPPPSPSKGKARQMSARPPESKFNPQLPPDLRTIPEQPQDFIIPIFGTPKVEAPTSPGLNETPEVSGMLEVVADAVGESLDALPDTEGVQYASEIGDDEVEAVSRRISEGAQIVPRSPVSRSSSAPSLLRVLVALLALLGSAGLWQYKRESAEIGFCEPGKATNAILEARRERFAAVESCNRENRTSLFPLPKADGAQSVFSPVPTVVTAEPVADGSEGRGIVTAETCPPPDVFPWRHANSCTPCPRHATCTPSTIICDNGYILRPHPLLYFLSVPGESPAQTMFPSMFTRPSHWLSASTDVAHLFYAAVSNVLDGLPEAGPVALPPHCAEDPRRKRHIGVLGKAVESMLASERGRRLCEGVGADLPEGDDAAEAQRWGVEVDKLKDDLRRKTAPNLVSTLDDTFNEAVQQLVQWGGVFMGEDAGGKRFLAHRTAAMSWDCALRVKARDSWAEWKRPIFTLLGLIASAYALRQRRASQRTEDERVASLVQIALDLLQNQERAHHTDPVTAPQPYLPSLQLRDLVLQDEHSVRARTRLWARVERVVEGNANVRTNLEEVAGGDEARVWTWVGGAGGLGPASPRLAIGES